MENCEISEEEFVSRLHTLGVDTHGLSFGWMLNEYDSEGVLRWIYNNFDSANALSKRESVRYAELKENDKLSETELDSAVTEIVNAHEGITLPGDEAGLKRAKKHNEFLRERLQMLNKHQKTVDTLLKQNQLAKEEVILQISELKDEEARSIAELELAKTDSLKAAETVTQKEKELYNTVAKHLRPYIDDEPSEEIMRHFAISGPLETYTQKRRQFKTQLKLLSARLLDTGRGRGEGGAHDDARSAKLAEKRLYDGIMSYVDAVSEYYYTSNVIEVMQNRPEVHSSRIPGLIAEKQSSLATLSQQEQLALEQLRAAARDLARRQTSTALSARAALALEQRRELHASLGEVHRLASRQTALAGALSLVLRRECRRAADTVRFAEDVRRYADCEREALIARMEAMTNLSREHRECKSRLERDNTVLNALNQLLETVPGDGWREKVEAIKRKRDEMKEEIEGEFEKKELYLDEMSKSLVPVADVIWDGRTRCPAMTDRTVSSLLCQTRTALVATEAQLASQVDVFTAARTKDKSMERKLWQWFLCEPDQLVSKIEELRTKYL